MMKKKSLYQNITPIPSHIPRQLAIDMLHNHVEIIQLNPLVIGQTPIKAPQSAPPDEFFSTWYEIEERIQYLPGLGRLGSGKIKFKGCFHDMPWGLQTHTYAPGGVDLRNKWQIRGNQPGEPPEHRELGSGAPAEGLYLREDVEIKCNPAVLGFVKKELKSASKVLVERLLKKAELIDAGILSAMFEEGKLKTYNPADRSQTFSLSERSSTFASQPGYAHSNAALSPNLSNYPPSPGLPYQSQNQSAYSRQSQYGMVPPAQGLAIEMPGSTHYIPDSQQPRLHPGQQQQHRFSSNVSELSASSPQNAAFPSASTTSDRRSYAASESSHPSSYTGYDPKPSPGQDLRAFVAELPGGGTPIPSRSPMPEAHTLHPSSHTPELQSRTPPPSHPSPKPPQEQIQQQYRYNPQDYARMS